MREVILRRSNNSIHNARPHKEKFIHVGMYFITAMVLLLFIKIFRYRRRQVTTPGHRTSPITLCSDALGNFNTETFTFYLTQVDPDSASYRVGQNNSQPFSLHRPGEDESIHLIDTSIIDTAMMSIEITVVTISPDYCQKI
jgi:hypothetical protein